MDSLITMVLKMNTNRRLGDFLIVGLIHRDTKKHQVIVVSVKASDAIRDMSWNRYWKLRARDEVANFLIDGYVIDRIFLESRNELSYFSYEVR